MTFNESKSKLHEKAEIMINKWKNSNVLQLEVDKVVGFSWCRKSCETHDKDFQQL